MKFARSIDCLAVCLCLALLVCGAGAAGSAEPAALPESDEELQLLQTVQQYKFPASSFDYFATAPPGDAWKAFRVATREMSPGFMESDPAKWAAMHKACVYFGRNKDAGAYLEKKIIAISPTPGNITARKEYYIEPLSRVPAMWAARIFGRLLFDDRLFVVREGGILDVSSSNPGLGAFALSNMHLAGTPETSMPITPEKVEEWLKWWKANESRLEGQLAKIQKEFLRQKSDLELEDELWSRTTTNYLYLGNEIAGGMDAAAIEKVEDLRSAPPEAAWKRLGSLVTNRTPIGKKLLLRAGQAIALNPKVQAFAETKFKLVTTSHQPEFEDLGRLGGIPAAWSVRILGSHLMNATPIDPAVMDQGDVSRSDNNQMKSVRALSALGFSDAPTKLDDDGFVKFPAGGSSALEEWRTWWKANEGRIEQRVREINSGDSLHSL